MLLLPFLVPFRLSAAEGCAPGAGAGIADRLRSGECYAAQERWKDAEAQFRAGRRIDRSSEAATVGHARALIHLHQPFDALIELNDLLQVSPDSVPALKLYAALVEAVLENRRQAEDVIQKCLKLAPSDAEVWQAAGSLYLSEQKTPEAIRSFEQAVRLSPRDPALVAGLALSYGQANHVDRATNLFHRALKMTEQSARPSPFVYQTYAEFLLDQNRPADSVLYFTRALSANPSADSYYGRAKAYEALQKWPRAEADAQAAIRRSPTRKDAHLLLVRVYRSMQDPGKAEQQLNLTKQLEQEERAAQALAQRSSEALRLYFELVAPRVREGRCAEAIPPCLKIVELRPEFPPPLFVLGVCYSQGGQPVPAFTFFQKYLALQPESADGHAALGMLLLEPKRLGEARKQLEQAISLDPELLEARKALASLHLAAGDFPAAVRVIRDGEAASPLDSEARLILAEALFRSHQLVPARRQLELVLNSEPANPAAVRLERLLLGESK